jgi:DNA-binding response OmpR family regulator
MSLRSPLVLIADDDRDMVDALSIRCRLLGLVVEHAYEGMNAICKIEELQPDLVVLDENMPGKRGLEIREVMCKDQYLSSIPTVIITGQGNMNIMCRSHDLLAYFVPKCNDFWSRIEPLIRELVPKATVSATASSIPEKCAIQAESNPTHWRVHPPESPPASCINDLFAALDASVHPKSSTMKSQDDGPQGTCPWVLCIDDDRELSHSLKMRLNRHHVRTMRASAGMQGYVSAFEHSPAVIILDYQLPDGNGDYILRRLKETPLTKDIPVIVITGDKNRSLERKMYNLGAAQFFSKPVKWDDLWAELKLHLERHFDVRPAS